jgi:hypothetical protein
MGASTAEPHDVVSKPLVLPLGTVVLPVRILSSSSNKASVKATVGKAEVYWGSNDRNEHEVICMPRRWEIVVT